MSIENDLKRIADALEILARVDNKEPSPTMSEVMVKSAPVVENPVNAATEAAEIKKAKTEATAQRNLIKGQLDALGIAYAPKTGTPTLEKLLAKAHQMGKTTAAPAAVLTPSLTSPIPQTVIGQPVQQTTSETVIGQPVQQTTSEPVQETIPVQNGSGSITTATIHDAITSLQAYGKSFGADNARILLSQRGAAKVSDLTPQQCAEMIAEVNSASKPGMFV